jgi:tetratricopeptide (TPR) repeat protein
VDTGRPKVAIDIAESLAAFLRRRRHLTDRVSVAQWAALAAEQFDNHGVRRYHEGMALTNLGNAFQEVQRFDEAITAYTAAVDICRESGRRDHESIALNNLDRALRAVWRLDEAITAHNAAVDICRATATDRAKATRQKASVAPCYRPSE